jgi:tetratricopeptide (TPR) repeat protein
MDREAILKQAEKLLRQGKLDGAIAEYVRLVEDQPRDWNAINALGDLYVRAGDAERAVAQFTRIADFLFAEGFLPKAAALYKKALKASGDHEPTLLQLGEIAGRQGLLADAKTYFRQLAKQRRARGDEPGAADALVRLASIEVADTESRIEGARAAAQVGDAARAAALLKEAGAAFENEQRAADALDAFAQAAQLDPADTALRAKLARECVSSGDFERARLFLTPESAGDDPDLLLALARIQMGGAGADPRPALMRLLTLTPERHRDVLQLCEEVAASGAVESAYGGIDVLTDLALLEGDLDRAIASLLAFLTRATHVPALVKLVEMCVDAQRPEPMRTAQARLADAYLEAGNITEARVIAEDLLAAEPGSKEHELRLRRALQALGVDDAEAALVRFDPEEELDLSDLASAMPDIASGDQGSGGDDEPILLEVDPSDAPAHIGSLTLEPSITTGPPQDLEDVFAGMRTRVAREQQLAGAANLYERGVAHASHGRIEEAVNDLQAAARVPLYRFAAAAQLGRLYITGGQLEAGVEWLERAAEAPAPTPDDGFAVLYELADTLDRLGESARALAVLMELDADAGAYRDVRDRVAQLSRVQAGGPGA